MNSIFINKKEYKVPGSYNELTMDQLLKLATVLFSGMEKIKARLMMLFCLVDIDKEDLNIINDEHVYDMLMVTDFAIEKITLTKNLISEIVPPLGKKLYGPSDELTNISFIEFIKCEKFYLKYIKDGHEQDLNGLVATMYRPKRIDMKPGDPRYDGDIREKYNDALVSDRAQEIAGINLHERQAIYMFYEGCRNYIIGSFPELFNKEEGVKSSVPNMGWVDVLMNLAGTKFGDFESTGATRLYTILFALKHNHHQQLLMEEELERRKKDGR